MSRLRHCWSLIWGLMLELSDQGAYQRYLTRRGVSASREEWRRFTDMRMRAKYQRAKCC